MRTDIPSAQRMTRAMGSASLGRALRRAPNPRPRPARPRRSGHRIGARRRVRLRRRSASADARLRRERPRLGARCRNGPVRRVRLREAWLRLPRNPRPLLPRHDDRSGAGPARARPACPEEGEADHLLHRGLHRHGRDRREARRRRGRGDLRLEAEAEGGRGGQGEGAPRPAPLRAGDGAARARPSLPRPDPGHRGRRQAPGGERPRARGVPPGRRAGRDAAHLRARGAEGPGGRRALVRALAPPDRQLRPLSGHAEPGLPRRRRRGAGDERGRPGDRGPGRALRRPGREDVLLLHLRRAHDVRGRRVGDADPLPRLRVRSVRHALALPRLGPLRLHRGEARQGAPRAGPAPRRADDRERLRPRGGRDGDRRERRVDRRRGGRAEGARPPFDVVQRRRRLALAAGERVAGRLRRPHEAHRARPLGLGGRAREPARDGEDVGERGPRQARRGGHLHGDREAEPHHVVPARGRHAPDGAGADPRRAARPLRPHRGQDLAERPRAPGAAEGARRDPAPRGRRLEHRRQHADRRERPVLGGAPAARGELPGSRDSGARLRPGDDEAARGRLGVRRLAAAAAATGLALAGSAAAARDTGFVPNDPLAPRQWYLSQDHAFDFWPSPLPPLAPVRVAVIDSGIDGGHPDLAARVVAAKSFVGGNPLTDEEGHGTFVAGEIAAVTDNGLGIAGIAFPAKLVVAKVVRSDEIPLGAETAAIRWAVNQGARVINLSLGGLRDPRDPLRDSFSPSEASAIDYAVTHGAVVVAAVGNGDQAPRTPWPYASYPAALPRVIGVSAFARDGSVPAFSNRDAVFNDLTAPGQDILSTLPRRLTAARPGCVDQGYSDCGSDDYVHASGTSFSAPQVSAAAALLVALQPTLKADQVSAILERTADDANASNGCRRCPLLRDLLTGWGRLNIANAVAALGGPWPPADRYETNDDAGAHASTP